MIRLATLDDIETLVDLGELLHKESSYGYLPFDRLKVCALMAGLIEGGYGIVFVAEKNGKIIGGIAGGVTEFWFCNELHGFDYSFFVHPEHRGGSSAFRLLVAFESWVEGMGAKHMDIGITTGIHEDKTGRFYEKMGFVKSGQLYRKILGA
jgi:GNAT superfamily N-acetyltransferase